MLPMTNQRKGSFSASLLSLQLQLKTLLEEAGGDHAVNFLNTVSSLNQSEQKVVLEVFTSIVNRIINGEQRLVTEGDLARKDFEDALYSDIIDAMRDAAHDASSKRLSVVAGGKEEKPRARAPISLCQARKSRKSPDKLLVN